jgi:hypothetical protein
LSELLFLPKEEIEALLRQQGLIAKAVYRTWDMRPFDENTSDEMIFLVEAT